MEQQAESQNPQSNQIPNPNIKHISGEKYKVEYIKFEEKKEEYSQNGAIGEEGGYIAFNNSENDYGVCLYSGQKIAIHRSGKKTIFVEEKSKNII